MIDFTTNYCGPYWNDGKFQQSKRGGKSKPVNEFDETCYVHDNAYADYAAGKISSLDQADEMFFQSNKGRGAKRTTAAYLVKYGNQAIRMFYYNPFNPPPTAPNIRTPYGPPKNVPYSKPEIEESGFCEVLDGLTTYTPTSVGFDTKPDISGDSGSNETEWSKNSEHDNYKMVKQNKNNKKQKQNKNKPKQGKSAKQQPKFGPVSTISTAPVAIGNSIRGSKARVTNLVDGCRVHGRDYAFNLAGTAASVTGWSLIGGMPITPAVLPSSILRNYTQMYSKFKIHQIHFHYITSSPSSQAGNVMFYYERDRKSPMIDYTNSSFLPYVLSDPNTIIGPQWTNHTLTIKPTDSFNLTNYGMTSDLNEDTCGSVFLFSKTNATSSPGYILIDYDISFKELCVNPRAGILPIARGQWNMMSTGTVALAVTSGSTNFNVGINGVDLGGSSSALVSGLTVGDIFKVCFDVTNSRVLNTWTNVTQANLLTITTSASNTAVTMDDGFTCYAVYSGTSFYYFATYEGAMTNTLQLKYGVTATVTYGLIGWYSLVGFNSDKLQASY